MKYEKAKNLKDKDFKRFFRVKKETFEEMCEVAKGVLGHENRGRNSDLSAEEQVLLTFSYWREYRTRVSSRTRSWDSRIECFKDNSENRRQFNQEWKVSLPSKRRLLEENELNYTIVV